MAYLRSEVSLDGSPVIEDHFSACQLYNASYNINVTFADSNQTILDAGTQTLNRVHYPQLSTPYSNDLMVDHAYSATFWAITDLLIGSMGGFTETSSATENTSTVFTEITTQIEYTSLLGSSDLDAFSMRIIVYRQAHPRTRHRRKGHRTLPWRKIRHLIC
jgi:hypothetical protein